MAAADQAIESLAFAEALAHLERSLEVWSQVGDPMSLSGRDETSLQLLAAHSAEALGRWRRATDLAQTALAGLDPVHRRDERIVVLIDISRWAMFADDAAARAAAIREAAELVPVERPSALRARVLSELAHLANHAGRGDEARRLAGEALDISRAIGARQSEAWALLRLAEALEGAMQYEAANRMLLEADRIAMEGDAPSEDLLGHLRFRRADGALAVGAFAQAIAMADSGLDRAAQAGTSGALSGFLRVIKIAALAALGRWKEAEALVDDARRDMDVLTRRMAVQEFVDVYLRQGRVADAAAAVCETDTGYITADEASFVLLARIQLANAEGRWDSARAAVDEAIGLFHDPVGAANALSILERSVLGEADHAEFARRRRRRTEEAGARRVGLAHLEIVRRGLGAASRGGGAGPVIQADLATAEAEGSRLEGRAEVKRWSVVARRRKALEQPWETAYARFRQAEAILATRGSKHDVLPLLREAHRTATHLGARPLVDQIERLARRGRIHLTSAHAERRVRRASTPEGVVVELTPREWEALSLVAAGHTNREIGDELFISEKTASVHVSNAMDKLGALSRYDAAASATRLGLLDASPGESSTR